MPKKTDIRSEMKEEFIESIELVIEHGEEIADLLKKATHLSEGENKWFLEMVENLKKPKTDKKMRRSPKKEQWLRDKKSSVKKKIIRSSYDLMRCSNISDIYSEEAFDEMFPPLFIGILLFNIARRKGIGDVTMYAHMMEKGLIEFSKREAESTIIPTINVSFKVDEESLVKVTKEVLEDVGKEIEEKQKKKKKSTTR
jgi:hypothetical protein